MAMGILAVFDMAGIDVGVNVHKANADRYPPDPTYYQADFALHEAGRLGQKNGKGYYRYEPGDRTRHDDPEAIAILRGARARSSASPQRAAQRRRRSSSAACIRCINEGIRILEEGVALRASDIDVVWTRGLRLPALSRRPDVLRRHHRPEDTARRHAASTASMFGPMHWEPAPLLVRARARRPDARGLGTLAADREEARR